MKKLELLKKELKSIQYNTTEKKLINIKVEEYNYTDDSELNNFLNNKSSEILNIIGNSTLILGKIFEEVKELCNKKEAENIYCAWLEYNGFNRMTALRYRNRYNILKK